MKIFKERKPGKQAILPVFLAALCGLSGCLPISVSPLYTQNDLVFDPTLTGAWSETEDSRETWTFEKAEEKGYKLVYKDEDGKTGHFEAHLLKLGDARFLDLFPDESDVEALGSSWLYKVHLLRTHSFLKVAQIEPTLRMAPLDLKWTREFLGKNPDAIRHEKVGDGDNAQIVFTASTRDLQRFVRKHLKTKGAFGELSTLERKQPETK